MVRTGRHHILFVVALISGLSACGPDNGAPPVSHQNQYLHVARDGYHGDDGTADHPLSYPANAVQKAFDEGYRGVKVATGIYDVSFNAVPLRFYGAIDIIGGCDRGTWEPVSGQYSTVAALNSPVSALGIQAATLIRGLEIVGTLAGANRPTSAAAYLDACGAGLRFEQCRFVAGPGYGYDDTPATRTPPEPAELPQAGGLGSCDSALQVPGGIAGWGGCFGGRGGDGGLPGSRGGDGRSGCDQAVLGGGGGAPGQDGVDGQDGNDGPAGEHATAMPGLGAIERSSVSPARAPDSPRGPAGSGGGGGGGGGGSPTGSGNGGGAGGSGGSGGAGADGGRGGGHSIGVICINSATSFVDCVFVADRGGRGSDGQDGTLGAAGSAGAPGGDACPDQLGRGGYGGRGGHGGASGGGAGGNGGFSVGLLVAGTVQPMVDSTCTFAVGVPGEPGRGGAHGLQQSRAESGYPGEAIGHLILPAHKNHKRGAHHLEFQN